MSDALRRGLCCRRVHVNLRGDLYGVSRRMITNNDKLETWMPDSRQTATALSPRPLGANPIPTSAGYEEPGTRVTPRGSLTYPPNGDPSGSMVYVQIHACSPCTRISIIAKLCVRNVEPQCSHPLSCQNSPKGHQQTWQTHYFLIFSSLFKLFVNYLTLYNVGPKII